MLFRSCSRGKASPNAATKLRIFTDSAGICQRPGCKTYLFIENNKKHPHIGEMAHVFAANDNGPRAKPELTAEERGDYKNIILFCANCHTIVDKTPEDHPAELMQRWKHEHRLKIEQAFHIYAAESREQLRAILTPLLAENAMVHKEIGPDNDYRFNPEAAEAHAWKTRVIHTIIPNSLRMVMTLDASRALLLEDELNTLERFRYHVQGLVMKHIEGKKLKNSFFPVEMNNLGK